MDNSVPLGDPRIGTHDPDDPRKMVYPTVPWRGFLRTYLPEAYDLHAKWEAQAHSGQQELDPKVRELVMVAIDAVVKWPEPFIDHHLHGAFGYGATVTEIAEVLLTCGLVEGDHTLNHGLTALERVMKERQAAGSPVPIRRGE